MEEERFKKKNFDEEKRGKEARRLLVVFGEGRRGGLKAMEKEREDIVRAKVWWCLFCFRANFEKGV